MEITITKLLNSKFCKYVNLPISRFYSRGFGDNVTTTSELSYTADFAWFCYRFGYLIFGENSAKSRTESPVHNPTDKVYLTSLPDLQIRH